MSQPLPSRSQVLLGLAYVLVIVLFVTFCVEVYRKALPWQHTVHVTVDATAAGLELSPNSDVKLQGMLVGTVRSITSDGQIAHIHLGLNPGSVHLIPADVHAAIVPATLFGASYVDLRIPVGSQTTAIANGDVITQTTTAVSVGSLLSQIAPILQALQPQQLSIVLNNLATAVDGRGATLAHAINQLGATLRAVNPHMGTAVDDLHQLATVANLYADEVPAVTEILNASAGISANLLVPHESDLATLLQQVIGTADTTRQVLAENTQRLITLVGRAGPVTALLRTYSSEIPCLLTGLHTTDILGDQAFGARGPFLSVTIDMITHHLPYTYPADLPGRSGNDANNDVLPSSVPNWNPHCPQFTAQVRALKDAPPYSLPYAGQTFQSSAPTGTAADAGTSLESAGASDAVFQARAALARLTAARLLGVPSDQVPSYASLLIEPLMSGEVPVQ